MKKHLLKITLRSDAAFSSGDGTAGIVDNEIQQDDLGCPMLSGREIKGILTEECAGILGAMQTNPARWQAAAATLFGRSGGMMGGQACWSFGDAHLPDDLRAALRHQMESLVHKSDNTRNRAAAIRQEFRTRVSNSLTTVHRQTAMDDHTGAPKEHTLRANRVVLSGTIFVSEIHYQADIPAGAGDHHGQVYEDSLMLLAACVQAFRRAGTGRNRGKGALEACLCDENLQPLPAFENFLTEVCK